MAAVTTKYVFDLRPGDVYWCTADCGWITGHTYLTYGPLLCGAQCVVFEGVPSYPSPARSWQVVEKYKVSSTTPFWCHNAVCCATIQACPALPCPALPCPALPCPALLIMPLSLVLPLSIVSFGPVI